MVASPKYATTVNTTNTGIILSAAKELLYLIIHVSMRNKHTDDQPGLDNKMT